MSFVDVIDLRIPENIVALLRSFSARA